MPVHVLPTLASRRGLGRRSSAQPGSDSDGDSSIHKRSASDMHDSISSQSMSGAKFYEMTQKAARQAGSHLGTVPLTCKASCCMSLTSEA
jgi:hypothetical protein